MRVQMNGFGVRIIQIPEVIVFRIRVVHFQAFVQCEKIFRPIDQMGALVYNYTIHRTINRTMVCYLIGGVR